MCTKKETIVINLIGGPGSGKSTVAAGIYYYLKKSGYNCELALEFAKDKVWEESYHVMNNQLYIFGKQFHRLWRLIDKVDIIITDSPLIMSLYYGRNNTTTSFNDFVLEQHNQFTSMNYFIVRNKDNYQTEGRLQTKEEAEVIDNELLELLKKYNIPFEKVLQYDAVNKIVDEIKRRAINN